MLNKRVTYSISCSDSIGKQSLDEQEDNVFRRLMMANISWLECATKYSLLLLVTSGLSVLPSVTCRKCNTGHVGEPLIQITSSPSAHALPVGVPINLTCKAWQTDDVATFVRRRPRDIQWYDPQDKPVGIKCHAPLGKSAKELWCPLMLGALALGTFGNYTCQVNNWLDYCRRSYYEINLQDIWTSAPPIKPTTVNTQSNYSEGSYNNSCKDGLRGKNCTDNQRPEIVDAPENQTASLASLVTFNCTVSGRPKPIITWIKDNDSYSVQSNPRAEVISDHKKIQSQLVITGVTSEDYGKYQCVAKNSAGVKTSKVAFLLPSNLDPTSSPRKSSNPKVTAIIVGCVVAAMVICGISVFLWYRRERGSRSKARMEDIPEANITGTDPDEQIRSQEPDELPLLCGSEINCDANLLLGSWHVDIPERSLPQASEVLPTPNIIKDTHPKMPTRPIKKDSTEPNEWLQSRSQDPKIQKSDTCVCSLNSKDVSSECPERSDTVAVVQDCIALDSERKSDGIQVSHEIEEGWEISLESLDLEVLDEVLGEGEFGIVYKGRYSGKDGKTIDVAVKQLKDTTSRTDKADMLSEIKILKQAGRHPHIVNLVGACIKEGNIIVVTELIPGGSLESLLKSKRAPGERNKYENVNCELNDRQLLTITLQVALGMQHLEEKKCIHRDLAARNVFIDANKVAKVGDFGMARDISDDGRYTKTSSGKVPWRWSSLESLRDRVYTSKSDVWSFGVVLWEIATYGEEPYPDITSPLSLVSWLSSGYRMPRPDHCLEELYTLMSSCWEENPSLRPTFADITKQLKYFLRETKRTYVNVKDDGITSEVESDK